MTFIIIILLVIIFFIWSNSQDNKHAAEAARRREEEERKKKLELERLAEEAQRDAMAEKLALLEKMSHMHERTKSRAEEGHRDGYVYIVSNPLSFGESVYKIGMTRRADPLQRIKDLNNASVPFDFDVYKNIYAEQASDLETQLHNKFDDFRLNKDNKRKEFFELSKEQIDETLFEMGIDNIKRL